MHRTDINPLTQWSRISSGREISCQRCFRCGSTLAASAYSQRQQKGSCLKVGFISDRVFSRARDHLLLEYVLYVLCAFLASKRPRATEAQLLRLRYATGTGQPTRSAKSRRENFLLLLLLLLRLSFALFSCLLCLRFLVALCPDRIRSIRYPVTSLDRWSLYATCYFCYAVCDQCSKKELAWHPRPTASLSICVPLLVVSVARTKAPRSLC